MSIQEYHTSVNTDEAHSYVKRDVTNCHVGIGVSHGPVTILVPNYHCLYDT